VEGSDEEKALVTRYPDVRTIFGNSDILFDKLKEEFGEIDSERRAE